MKRHGKIFISICLIVALLSCVTVSAVAGVDPVSISLGGLFASFLSASGVSLLPSGFDSQSFDNYWMFSNPLGLNTSSFISNISATISFADSLYDVIFFSGDSVGGSSLSLSSSASDYIADNSISSDSSASLYSYNGSTFNGIPLDGSVHFSQSIVNTDITSSFTLYTPFGDYATIRFSNGSNGWRDGHLYQQDTNGVFHDTYFNVRYPVATGPLYLTYILTQSHPRLVLVSPGYSCYSSYYSYYSVDSSNYSINYSSSSVDSSFPSDGYLKVSLPSGTLSNYAEGQVDDMFDLIGLFEDLTDSFLDGDVIFSEKVSDVPPSPVPIPDTQLGQVPFDDWFDLFGSGVLSGLDSLSDIASSIGSSISSGVSSIVESISGIASESLDLVQSLFEGISSSFSDLFSDLKSSFGIWHYVVEWLSSISSSFSLFFGLLSSLSYSAVLPIYASVAGIIVITFYKRFGR